MTIRVETQADADHILDLLNGSYAEGFWYVRDHALATRLLAEYPELCEDYGFLLNYTGDSDPKDK